MSLLHFNPFGDPLHQMDRFTSQLLSGTRTPMAMPMDVWRSADGYHVCLDLPGVDPSTVDITSEKNVITISADRQAEFGEADQVLLAERPQGSFTRQLQLGDGADAQNVQASYTNGVLCLTIPTAPESQPRRIEVQHSQAPQQVTIAGDTADDPSGSPAQSTPTADQGGGSTHDS